MSTCQYILGIGDRHLSNSMIDLNTGQMVGIDFGHAFGSATQVSIFRSLFGNTDLTLIRPCFHCRKVVVIRRGLINYLFHYFESSY
jgi:hypothetical protein